MSKANNKKKLEQLYDKAVMIRCCYCDLKNNCDKRKAKEKSEKLGFTTYCALTPNRPRSHVKSHRGKPSKH